MIDLKPCPFCGNDGSGPVEDALHVHHNEPLERDERHTWTVQCDRCTATMGYSDSEDEAIEAWNCRVQGAARTAVTVGNIVSQIAIWSDDEGLDLSYGQGDDLARRILSALSAHPCTTSPVVDHETANVDGKPVKRLSFTIPDPGIIEIPIRPDLVVRIHGIPFDFTKAEAEKVVGVIQAYANVA